MDKKLHTYNRGTKSAAITTVNVDERRSVNLTVNSNYDVAMLTFDAKTCRN